MNQPFKNYWIGVMLFSRAFDDAYWMASGPGVTVPNWDTIPRLDKYSFGCELSDEGLAAFEHEMFMWRETYNVPTTRDEIAAFVSENLP